ncbi:MULTISPECIES: ABC transporter permease [Actinomyces]|uniref:ABC transporter permease n=1 Tax=Actinomyces respiraculi TaxID=2744574 RepID=A0A7T0PXW6_9ACTO|nr:MULTISPECIES: ABC transporter permease [Actinomyces]QPL06025.1 ABC transporter permease [Actinomyces respiraculi]
MTNLLAALAYIADPANWSGSLGIAHLLTEHVIYSLLGVVIAAAVGVPLGWAVGHSGRGRDAVAAFSGAARALPTLGLVTVLGLWLGIGLTAPLLAFAVLALPSVLAGAYAGVESADRLAVDAARASGMTELQVLARVEVPLGAPLLVGGLRAAVLQVIATATLAAYTGAGGLGRLMFLGLKTQDYPMMLASALLVIALALVSDIVFLPLQRLAVPAGSRPRKDT